MNTVYYINTRYLCIKIVFCTFNFLLDWLRKTLLRILTVFQHCWRKFCFIFFNLILRSLSIPKSSYFGSEFWPVSQLIALFVISNLNRTRQRNNAHKIEKIISWQKSFTNFWILGIPEQITWTRLRQKYKLNIDETRISYMLIVLDYDIVRKTVLELHTRR